MSDVSADRGIEFLCSVPALFPGVYQPHFKFCDGGPHDDRAEFLLPVLISLRGRLLCFVLAFPYPPFEAGYLLLPIKCFRSASMFQHKIGCYVLLFSLPVLCCLLLTVAWHMQLDKFVMEERRRHTIYPAPEDVFTWTRCCDIDEVS